MITNKIYIVVAISFALVFSLTDSQAQGPAPPVINWVSVKNGTDSVEINWTLSKDTDVVRYVIFKTDPTFVSGWVRIDSSLSSTNNTCTFKDDSVLRNVVFYKMCAVNSKGLPGPLGKYHATNFLKVSPDTCSFILHLQWTGYVGWGDSLLKYQVNVKEGTLPERLYTQKDSITLSTDYTSVQSGIVYCFVIVAINNDSSTSYSNRICKSLRIPRTPNYINADYASDDPSGGIKLSFSFDASSELKRYSLFRRESENGPDSIIHTFYEANGGSLTYNDTFADPLLHHYYRLKAQNSCGNDMGPPSNFAENIVLHAKENGAEVLLNYNKYKWWEGRNGMDTLMRSTSSGGWEFAAALNSTDSIYTDDLKLLSYHNYNDKICYYVKANEGNSNPYGIKGTSLSNKVCVNVPPAVKIPNVFTPNGDGLNDEFKPEFDFKPDEQQYLLKIFDRNGNLLFQSTTPNESWKGTDMKGRKVQQGTYVYYLRYGFQNQSVKELRGTISILYP
jgi:gliding motility-associated-like protein